MSIFFTTSRRKSRHLPRWLAWSFWLVRKSSRFPLRLCRKPCGNKDWLWIRAFRSNLQMDVRKIWIKIWRKYFYLNCFVVIVIAVVVVCFCMFLSFFVIVVVVVVLVVIIVVVCCCMFCLFLSCLLLLLLLLSSLLLLLYIVVCFCVCFCLFCYCCCCHLHCCCFCCCCCCCCWQSRWTSLVGKSFFLITCGRNAFLVKRIEVRVSRVRQSNFPIVDVLQMLHIVEKKNFKTKLLIPTSKQQETTLLSTTTRIWCKQQHYFISFLLWSFLFSFLVCLSVSLLACLFVWFVWLLVVGLFVCLFSQTSVFSLLFLFLSPLWPLIIHHLLFFFALFQTL